METVAAPPAGDRVEKFEHVSVKARGRLNGTERFIEQGLGFGFSDRMGRTASWWHCDADHHGMAARPRAQARALPLRLHAPRT